jgi:hypothetical protein
MAKFSMKVKGNEVGPASIYAQPHTMSGGTEVSLGNNGYPNKVANTQTERTRGTKNTTRGYGHSKKMG